MPSRQVLAGREVGKRWEENGAIDAAARVAFRRTSLEPAFVPVRFDALTQVGFDSLPLAGEGDTLAPAMSKQVIVELPEGAFSAFRSDPAELGREMRLAASVKWYELGRLTQAKAAEFAGLSRYEFIHALGRFGASPLQETVEELAETLNRER